MPTANCQLSLLVTTYSYDGIGNLSGIVLPNGVAVTYAYDNMNRRKSRQLPGGQIETYDSYDQTGNLTHKTTFDQKGISYNYFTNGGNDDLLSSETFAEGSISYNYDGFLRRQSMTDGSGQTTYNYDSRDRMTAKNTTNFGNLTYGYDNHGNLTSIQSSNSNGANVEYGYDTLNRPTTVIDQHRSLNLTTTYSYDGIGNLSGIVSPNGVAVTYAYDQLNRLNSMKSLHTSNSSLLTSYTYTLGAAGNRLSVNEYSNRNVHGPTTTCTGLRASKSRPSTSPTRRGR